MRNVVDAKSVDKTKKNEQESICAEVNVDVAVVLPSDLAPDTQVELQYDVITKAVNDYIERYTIDARIDKVNYNLSIPKLSDDEATNNLEGTLTGATSEITTSKCDMHVENDAICDDKVTLTFELSVEENVYLDDVDETYLKGNSQSQDLSSFSQDAFQEESSSQDGNSHSQGDLIIQSAEPNLCWQSASNADLYWENVPSSSLIPHNTNINNSTGTRDEVLDISGRIGSGLDSAMDSVSVKPWDLQNVRAYKQNLRYGDNGRVYTNPHARGNRYYRIAGNLSDNRAVSRLGTAGKVISYGTTIYNAREEYAKASTSHDKGRVVGATAGKVGAGTLAGTVASAATTAVLVTIAGAAGVAAAPVTLIVIAGCSIVAGVAASSAVEGIGEEIGGNAGAGAVNWWQSRTKNK